MLTIKTTQELVNKLAIMVRNYDAFTNYIDDYKQLLSVEARNNTLAKDFVALCQANGIEASENTCFLLASEYNVAYAQQTLEEVLAEYVATHATNETINNSTNNQEEETMNMNEEMNQNQAIVNPIPVAPATPAIPVIPVAPATETPKFRSPMIPVAETTVVENANTDNYAQIDDQQVAQVIAQCLKVQWESKRQKAKNYISDFMVESCTNFVLHKKYTKIWDEKAKAIKDNVFTDAEKAQTKELKERVLHSDCLKPYAKGKGDGYIIKARYLARYYAITLGHDVVYRFNGKTETRDYLVDGETAILRTIVLDSKAPRGFKYANDIINLLDDIAWSKLDGDAISYVCAIERPAQKTPMEIINEIYEETKMLMMRPDCEERSIRALQLSEMLVMADKQRDITDVNVNPMTLYLDNAMVDIVRETLQNMIV